MRRDEPAWWYAADSGADRRIALLRPLGRLYGWIAERRFRRATPYRASLPVICIGNFTAGGTGKTPLGLLIGAEAKARGLSPVYLSRGYGGSARTPMEVVAGATTSAEAGDEPLILARAAPTVVAPNRAAGARLIETRWPEARVIIMDDGLQNGSLAKDLTIAVVDGARGLGNGETMPAGPLRAPLGFQLELADAIVVNVPAGEPGPNAVTERLRTLFQGPVLEATVQTTGACDWLRNRPVVAFAGIGHPARFFRTLAAEGAELAAARAFPDHHRFTAREAEDLLALARRHGALLVTTEKDLARLDGTDPACRALRAAARALPVALRLGERDMARLGALIDGVAAARRVR